MSPFAELALAVAILVCVPVAVRLLFSGPTYRRLATLHPIAAALAVVSMLVPVGLVAVLLAFAWLLFAGVCAAYAWGRALSRSTFRLEESVIDVAFGYLLVGAVWLLIWRSGTASADVESHSALLTAVHFHFAGFVSLILCGLAGRVIRAEGVHRWRVTRAALVVVLIGPAAVAVGIVSRSALEQPAALVFALGTAVVAWHTFRFVAPRSKTRSGAVLLRVSSLSAGIAMVLVWIYVGMPLVFGSVFLDVPAMARTHGILNSVGYSLVGLVAWTLVGPMSSALASRPPFSSIRGGTHAGTDFFERHALTTATRTVRGLVDSLDEYASPDFDPRQVDPRIRAFYEDTASFDLTLFPHWRGGLRAFAAGYAGITARLEQVYYAVAQGDGEPIESRIVGLDAAKDGRPGVRGWVRWYRRSGKSIYVAAYATHRDARRAYMNIAFPLPGGNLASILRPSNAGTAGLCLTSRADPQAPGDEGVYFASVLPVRLPIDETIRVWTVGDTQVPLDLLRRRRDATLAVARHDVWLFGLHALTLDYTIEPVGTIRSTQEASPK